MYILSIIRVQIEKEKSLICIFIENKVFYFNKRNFPVKK